MKVLLIGATGFVGSPILQELLSRGHQVTAVVRHPEKLTVQHPQLVAVKGDVLHAKELAVLAKGSDAVVSAYNPGWANPNIHDEFLEGAKAIQSGTKQAGVKRLLVIGGAGSLYVAPGVQIIDTPGFPEAFKAGASAAVEYLNILTEEKELDWTFFSPAIEMSPANPGTRTGRYRTGTDNPVLNEQERSILSVEDLAVVIADELEHQQFSRRRFTAEY